jgi:hypothetical protein
MKSLLDNPEHWRERAEEARAQAEQMQDADTRRIMLAVAESYEKMAHKAERRLADRRREGGQ